MRKSYRRTWRCIMAAGMTVGMTAVFLTGCGKRQRKADATMTERLANVESFTNTFEMDLKMEDVVHYTKVTMDMTMETTLDPKAGHAKGQAEVVMRGTTLNSEMEIYQVEEGRCCHNLQRYGRSVGKRADGWRCFRSVCGYGSVWR